MIALQVHKSKQILQFLQHISKCSISIQDIEILSAFYFHLAIERLSIIYFTSEQLSVLTLVENLIKNSWNYFHPDVINLSFYSSLPSCHTYCISKDSVIH